MGTEPFGKYRQAAAFLSALAEYEAADSSVPDRIRTGLNVPYLTHELMVDHCFEKQLFHNYIKIFKRVKKYKFQACFSYIIYSKRCMQCK